MESDCKSFCIFISYKCIIFRYMHQPAELRGYFSMQKGTAAKESLLSFSFAAVPLMYINFSVFSQRRPYRSI